MTEKITPKQQEILDEITPIFVEKFGLNKSDIKMDETLDGLDLVAMDCIELFMDLQIKLDLSIPDEELGTIRTIGDIVRLIERMSTKFNKTVAPKAAEPVQKPAIQKPSAKKTMVTLTNIPQGLGERTKLNCGEITEKQKQDFLASIMRFDPESTNFANHCGFNLYYDKFNAWVTPFDMKRNYKPQYRRNGDKEMVIETMPMKSPECGAYEKSECPKYLADGKCTSPLVKRTVGALLFPDKYGNER